MKKILTKCPRCGNTHLDMEFKELSNTENTYWSTCYETREPIILKLEPVSEAETEKKLRQQEKSFIKEAKKSVYKCIVCDEETTKRVKYCSNKCKNMYDKYKRFIKTHITEITLKEFKQNVHKCYFCDRTNHIRVFHLDRNEDNNEPENIVGICPSCYLKETGVFKSTNKN